MIILHLTTDTNFGGVQQCVLGICRNSAVQGHPYNHHVLRVNPGSLEERFRKFAVIHDSGPHHESCRAIINAVKPDIIHMHMPGGEFPEYAEQIAGTGIPLIENIHCVRSAVPREEEVMRARIVNSRYVQNLQNCKERLHIIPHAIDEDEWAMVQGEHVRKELLALRERELNIPRDTQAIGRIGNITPWKRVTDFVHAVPLILRSAKKAPEFLLAGAVHENPAYAGSVLRAAKMLFIENRIRFLWNIAQKFAFLGMLDLFLYPTSKEGFCIAAIEAMSMGLPVITYNDSAMPETVTPEAGVLVEKGDIDGLAKAAVSLLENPEMLRAKSEAARTLVMSRNMPTQVFSQYERLYEQCA